MSNTIYVKIGEETIPYTKSEIRGMFSSQIKTVKKNLLNKEDSKTIDRWLQPEPKE